jgi:hypothetical protein
MGSNMDIERLATALQERYNVLLGQFQAEHPDAPLEFFEDWLAWEAENPQEAANGGNSGEGVA